VFFKYSAGSVTSTFYNLKFINNEGKGKQGCRQNRRIYCYDTEKKKDPELFPFYDMDRQTTS